MKINQTLLLCTMLSLFACQPETSSTVTILDSGQIYSTPTSERVPSKVLAQVGLVLGANDEILFNGLPVPPDTPLPLAQNTTLQIMRAVTLFINGKSVQAVPGQLGDVLEAMGTQLYSADKLVPPLDTFIPGPMKIVQIPSQIFKVQVDGRQIVIRSSATTISSALAEAGIPLLGLDFTQPSEDMPLPQDGNIRVIRVFESILLAQKSIPFPSEYQASADVELDHQEILQPGQPGLSVSRTRIRYEDGKEVSRQAESETIVHPPQARLVGYGTKVVVYTAIVDGVSIQYWRSIQMYATAYSPCNSGVKGQCFSGTSSGLPAGKGVVAVDPSLYSIIAGQQLFIPGYGIATVGDVGGGYIIEKLLGISRTRWIDLGYSDTEFAQSGDQWGKYVTVYFLAPVPANIPNPLN